MTLGRQGDTGWRVEKVGSGEGSPFLILFGRATYWDKKGKLVAYGLTPRSALDKASKKSEGRRTT